MKRKALLVVYGEGGHRAQMQRFLKIVEAEGVGYDLGIVAIAEKADVISGYETFTVFPLRDKYNRLLTLIKFFPALISYCVKIVQVLRRYSVSGLVSTGPGLAIIPAIIFRLLGKKVVFIETWSRFETASLTGRIMYRVASRFYIQNKALSKHYPKAIYGGLL